MRVSISVKFSGLVLLTVLSTASLLFAFFLVLIHDELSSQLEKRGASITRMLSYQVAPLLLGKDDAKIAAALENLLKDSDVVEATVLDADGKVVADRSPATVGRSFSDPRLPPDRLGTTGLVEDKQARRFLFHQPATFSQKRTGTVIVQVSQGALETATKEVTSRILVLIGVIVGVLLLASALFLKHTLRPLQRVIEGTQRLARGDFSTRIQIKSQDEIGDVAESFNSMAAHAELFFRYVDKSIARRLSEDESLARPGGRMKQVSVVFGDMRGYTALSNNRTPEEVVGILNTYYDLFFRIIHRFQGVVDKTMGDAVMAFFEGRDTKRTDHSINATLSACAMRASVWALEKITNEALRQGLPIKLEPQLFGFAVATGRMIVGNIGSDLRMDYTVCGPAVNLASRLQDETVHGEVVTDRFTALDVEGLVVMRQLEPVLPKGFAPNQQVTPFQIVGIKLDQAGKLGELLHELLDRGFFRRHMETWLDLPPDGPRDDLTKRLDKLAAISSEIIGLEISSTIFS